MTQFTPIDIIGNFQAARQNNANLENTRRQGTLMDLAAQQKQLQFGQDMLNQQSQSRASDIKDKERQAVIINRGAVALSKLPTLSERQAAFGKMKPLLEQTGIDTSSFTPDSFSNESLQQTIAATSAFIEGDKSKKSASDTPTANVKDFEYYQSLKDKDPESAKMFAKDVGLIPKDKQLSARAESALIDSQDRFFDLSNQTREYEILADDFQRYEDSLPAGSPSTFKEFLKSVTGSQDEASDLRRRFSKVRMSEALKYLPPGPATDRDVTEAFKGVPSENANPAQIQSFLRGAAKMASIDRDFQEFRSDYISENNSTKGLLRAWEKEINGGNVESVNALTPARDQRSPVEPPVNRSTPVRDQGSNVSIEDLVSRYAD